MAALVGSRLAAELQKLVESRFRSWVDVRSKDDRPAGLRKIPWTTYI